MFNYIMQCKSIGIVAKGKVSFVPRIGESVDINGVAFEVTGIMYDFSPDAICFNNLVISVKRM